MDITVKFFLWFTQFIAYLNTLFNPNKIDAIYIYSDNLNAYYKYKWYHLYLYLLPWQRYNMVLNIGLLYYIKRCNIYDTFNKNLLKSGMIQFSLTKKETITDPKIVLAKILQNRNIANGIFNASNSSKKLTLIKNGTTNTHFFNLLIDKKNVYHEDGMERHTKYFLLQQSDINRKELSRIKFIDDWSY